MTLTQLSLYSLIHLQSPYRYVLQFTHLVFDDVTDELGIQGAPPSLWAATNGDSGVSLHEVRHW